MYVSEPNTWAIVHAGRRIPKQLFCPKSKKEEHNEQFKISNKNVSAI